MKNQAFGHPRLQSHLFHSGFLESAFGETTPRNLQNIQTLALGFLFAAYVVVEFRGHLLTPSLQ